MGYGLWVLVNVFLTYFDIGDGGVASHLALLWTGAPASLLSLALPNGSLLGVLGAGVLGGVQWSLFAQIYRPR
jgi:hypothetical protein